MPTPQEVADDFKSQVESIFDTYCCNLCSIVLARDFIAKMMNENPIIENKLVALTTRTMVDDNYFLFTTRTNGELLKGPTEEGKQPVILGRMLVVFLFELWEHHFRPLFSKAHGDQNVSSNFFGDLRLLRNCIVHNNAVCDSKTAKELCVLPRHKEDEVITIGFLGAMLIRQLLFDSIEVLRTEPVEALTRPQADAFNLNYQHLPFEDRWLALAYSP
jgi:hypothetical protein